MMIAYQIRQSFKPGEITPEEANKVGYETAIFTRENTRLSWLPMLIVHIHNHIILIQLH